jgi:hypothetical protein
MKNKLLLYYTAWQLLFILCALASPSFSTAPPLPSSSYPSVRSSPSPLNTVFMSEVSFELYTATSINDHYSSLHVMLKLTLSWARITAQSVLCLGYWLADQEIVARFQYRQNFSSAHSQTTTEANAAPLPWVIGGSFVRYKVAITWSQSFTCT